ncbi:MAG TPA: bifunctional adenosylcobinamide kinase/adenosylcobinamide-phosphate guanylyltransferase [Planctomycetota bacterium]|jgi:adenosylcobinamide kinase/adenosylcobinamide-phosphate guanylyltransferase
MARIIMYTGGARSGKSRLAQDRLKNLARVVYIATAQAFDNEMTERIAKHKDSRPAEWITVEEPLDLAAAVARALASHPQAILIDCLTLWLSNRMLNEWQEGWNTAREDHTLRVLDEALQQLGTADGDVVLVTNEVGSSVVPESEMGRAFRDLAGRANQLAASKATEVHLVVAGLALQLK